MFYMLQSCYNKKRASRPFSAGYEHPAIPLLRARFKQSLNPAFCAGNYFPNKLSTFASATFNRCSISSSAGSAGAATASKIC